MLPLIKFTVVCALPADEIIELYFFEDDAGHAVTVTEERYRAAIEKLLRLTIQNSPDSWFQQDGDTANILQERQCRGNFGGTGLSLAKAMSTGHHVPQI